MPGWEHETAEANGVRLHYRRAGDGPAVVLLHGFPQTGRCWDRIAPLLAERYTLVAPDLRGAGESARSVHGFDKRTMASDVRALVAGLGFDRVHVVGHDIGGMVAYAWAAQWPGEVERLVLIEMLLPGFGLEKLWAVSSPGEFAHMPFFMTQDLPEWLVAGREAAFFDWFMRNLVFDQTAFSPTDIAAYVAAYARPGALRAGFDWYRAFWQDAEDNKVLGRTRLPMPVLAIGGESSLAGALTDSLAALADDVRGAIVERCGHFIPEERPQQLAHELLAFLDGG